ncbi:hypothetical protein EJ05DRAFT_392693 [Pseudovirgaria hyperparasitica]|uniref:Cenp-O kinetochore centromere component n=1 Tax=Pseudovirgaria hyperparasitica TaxID=470096 RepID=A0A6A6W3K9_9PEZI|nr:uncharacterized protein EJ05DRAFT_392693 [Pseudovirgaria hyperparasitica]KAF2757528.1 hypothetical protein EJ05DRAFT_392693 [Pseudovirgaria hyperparasitica]
MSIEALRSEITSLESQLKALESLLPHAHSTLLSLPSIAAALKRSTSTSPSIARARAHLTRQLAHNTHMNYRLTSGITAFRVQDPDPYAVDSGRVLGLRIELPQGATFGTPYFVFLVAVRVAGQGEEEGEQQSRRRLLKVHKHTVPPAVPIDALARRWLALPGKTGKMVRKQDLHAFGRALRHAVVSFHARLAAVEKLRVDAGLEGKGEGRDAEDGEKRRKGKGGIVAITADEAAHTVDITFKSGLVGRLRMNRAGAIEHVVVKRALDANADDETAQRKRRELKRRITGGDGRIEGVVDRILGNSEG